MSHERMLGDIAWAAGAAGCERPSDSKSGEVSDLIGQDTLMEQLEVLESTRGPDDPVVRMFQIQAAFLCDLARKFDYLFQATAEFAERGREPFASMIRAHDEFMNRDEEDMARKARNAARVLRRMDEEIHREYAARREAFTGSTIDEVRERENQLLGD